MAIKKTSKVLSVSDALRVSKSTPSGHATKHGRVYDKLLKLKPGQAMEIDAGAYNSGRLLGWLAVAGVNFAKRGDKCYGYKPEKP